MPENEKEMASLVSYFRNPERCRQQYLEAWDRGRRVLALYNEAIAAIKRGRPCFLKKGEEKLWDRDMRVRVKLREEILFDLGLTGSGWQVGIIDEVLAERERQKAVEGWTPEHDDEHDDGQLARAAACYADPVLNTIPTCPRSWPWHKKWWKPTTQRRALVKAAALIVAEIERLDRKNA